MGSNAFEADVRRYRPPWFWLVLLAFAACAVSVLVLLAAGARRAQNVAEFDSLQTVRLQRAAVSVDDFLGDGMQLAAAAADMLGSIRGNRPLVERLLSGLARSHSNVAVYGLGIFYAPRYFDDRTRLFGPYDVVGPPLHEIRNTDKNYAYPKLHWYRTAQQAHGAIVVIGPYDEHGRSFVSVLKGFYAGNRFGGVASVDTLTDSMKAALTSAIAPTDVAYVTNPAGTVLLSSGPLGDTRNGRIDRALKLRYSHASLHLSTDSAPLAAANRQVTANAALSIVGTWLLAALFAFALMRAWRSRQSTLNLELHRQGLQQEIDVRKQIESGLREAAYTDALTGLPNRTPFLEKLSELLRGSGPDARRYGVFFIDLDRFNMVNDTLGHPAGDELLKMIAARLRGELPPEAMVARLGGDEFVIVMPVDDETAQRAEFLLACLREPVTLRGRTLYTAASIGVVRVDREYRHPDELLRDADIAMYQAKRLGRARFAIFDRTMRRRIDEESSLENDLHRGIERREFVAHYQPVVDMRTGAIASFEALVRWHHPVRGLLEAVDFIGFAESHGMVDAIDVLTLQDVCRDAPALFNRFPGSSIAVNLSAAHLTAPDLIQTVIGLLRSYQVAPDSIAFEITETAVMTNAVHAQATLERLRQIGIRTVLDDFGQGHSSLAYLQHLPIAGVKIDRSFVEPLADDPQSVAIARSIVALANTLGLYTVAEGVETPHQLAVVASLGVDYAQGFLFSRALPLADILDRLDSSFPIEGSVPPTLRLAGESQG
jgi:diguanylate cyclase (GGDEF)-like protein